MILYYYHAILASMLVHYLFFTCDEVRWSQSLSIGSVDSTGSIAISDEL